MPKVKVIITAEDGVTVLDELTLSPFTRRLTLPADTEGALANAVRDVIESSHKFEVDEEEED